MRESPDPFALRLNRLIQRQRERKTKRDPDRERKNHFPVLPVLSISFALFTPP